MATNPNSEAIPPGDNRTLWFIVSLASVGNCVVSLLDHQAVFAFTVKAALLLLALCFAFQFGSRIFAAQQAANRTATLTDNQKQSIRRVQTIMTSLALVGMFVSAGWNLGARHHMSSNWMTLFYVPVWLGPIALNDLLGQQPRTYSTTFAPRIDWADTKPLYSDKWGH